MSKSYKIQEKSQQNIQWSFNIPRYAKDLEQLDNGVKIPPKGWKCEKCDLTCNLWLNLTDGSILCGRKVVTNQYSYCTGCPI